MAWSLSTPLGDHPEALLVGGFLIAVYQAAKFSELDLADPFTHRYVARIHGIKAKDFAGASAYYIAFTAFIVASVGLYYLACMISEPVSAGAIQLLSGHKPDLKGIPFPLYIAGVFLGLVQPTIPSLAKVGNVQRNFFHGRIDVPRRLIELSEKLTTAVSLRSGSHRRELLKEIKHLISEDWKRQIEADADLVFYNGQLGRVGLNDPDKAAAKLKLSSAYELRDLVEQLILLNLIAVMRQSGPNRLPEVARWFDPDVEIPPHEFGRFISGLVLSGLLFGLAVLTILHILDLLRPLVERYSGGGLWPKTDYLSGELGRIVPSIFVCLLISVCMLPKDTMGLELLKRKHGKLVMTSNFLIEFGKYIGMILIVCFVVSLTIHFTAEFYQYGTAREFADNQSTAKWAIIFVRTMPSLAISYCTLLYLSLHRDGYKASFLAMMTWIALVIAALALLVALTFLRLDFLVAYADPGAGWDYALFYVLANVLVSVAAFACTILFFRAQTAAAPQAVTVLRTALQRRRARAR